MCEDGYLSVRNWHRFQHYKDRNPIWIKFYVELLDDHQIRSLSVPTRLLLDQLLLLAARHDNAIANDSEEIANLTRMPLGDVREGIETLLQIRWLRHTQTPRRASKAASKRASNLDSNLLAQRKRREETPISPFSSTPKPRRRVATTDNGKAPMPTPIAETWAKFLDGHGWDDSYDQAMILDELRRQRESTHTEGTLGDEEALELWREQLAKRYPRNVA